MERYTDAWDKTYQDMTWGLPCEPGTSFECTQNVIQEIIVWLPRMFKKYKKMRGIEMIFEISDAYRDPETYETWYRVHYKIKEN